jgi:hypothetical protein
MAVLEKKKKKEQKQNNTFRQFEFNRTRYPARAAVSLPRRKKNGSLSHKIWKASIANGSPSCSLLAAMKRGLVIPFVFATLQEFVTS